MSERTDRTISLHLAGGAGNAGRRRIGGARLVATKGRVLDAMVDTSPPCGGAWSITIDQGAARPAEGTRPRELARLALKAPDPPAPTSAERQIRSARSAKKERLEAELAEHSAEFRAQMQPVTLEAVQAAMPDDAALLEFAVFRPFDPRAERNADAYGPPHYAAYVVRKHAGTARLRSRCGQRRSTRRSTRCGRRLRDPGALT